MSGKGGGKSLTGGSGNGPLPSMQKTRGVAANGTQGHPVGGKGTKLTGQLPYSG